MIDPLFPSRDPVLELAQAQWPVGEGLQLLAMLHLHIRHLRQVTIVYGHKVADAVPAAVAARLHQILRKVDHIARIGEDDFLVILPQLRSAGHAELATQRILREFQRPLLVKDRLISVVLVMGIALSCQHGENAEELGRAATTALDQAVMHGVRSMTAVEKPDAPVLLDELRDALVNNELTCEFQPIIETRHRKVVAVEALARWNCPRRGFISPTRFIPVAENDGLATELTRWTLHVGLREYAALRKKQPGLRCHLNLSPRAFSQSGLVEQVHSSLGIWGVPATELVVEVTETAVMDEPEICARVLQGLRDSGIGVAIDDFGTGNATFSYLRFLPATELKIDQSFAINLLQDVRTVQIVRSMVDLAHNLGMTVTLEGIEDTEALNLLRTLGCDYAQGFALGRPKLAADWSK